jgi:hypothetical protein
VNAGYAREIGDLLVKCYGFDAKDVLVLTNAGATKNAVLDALNKLAADSATPNDKLIICFAGSNIDKCRLFAMMSRSS